MENDLLWARLIGPGIQLILELGYYPVSVGCIGEGAQNVNGEWYMPRWGCDTLQHVLDVWGDRPSLPDTGERTASDLVYKEEAPTVPGWYWRRGNGRQAPVEVYEKDGELFILGNYWPEKVAMMFGYEWAGPISAPGDTKALVSQPE